MQNEKIDFVTRTSDISKILRPWFRYFRLGTLSVGCRTKDSYLHEIRNYNLWITIMLGEQLDYQYNEMIIFK